MINSKNEQIKELRDNSKIGIINGKKVLFAKPGLSVTNKVFINDKKSNDLIITNKTKIEII